jgi:hypothetical protein
VAHDDWRIRVELEGAVDRLLERLGVELHDEARELAAGLSHRLPVSRDEDTVFVYADSALQAERARAVVEAELDAEGLRARKITVEHWLGEEDRWDNEPTGPTWEEEVLARGFAPWEVRVECRSHREADELADRLEQEGQDVVRRWRYLVVGTSSREEAEQLAHRLHGDVEPGGALVWEVLPHNPFSVFGGLGGTGTPL